MRKSIGPLNLKQFGALNPLSCQDCQRSDVSEMPTPPIEPILKWFCGFIYDQNKGLHFVRCTRQPVDLALHLCLLFFSKMKIGSVKTLVGRKLLVEACYVCVRTKPLQLLTATVDEVSLLR